MTAPVTSTGPFVVTVRRPHSADCGLVPPMGVCTCAARILYREAFATLEGARDAVQRIVDQLAMAQNGAIPYHDLLPALHALAVLPESGGSIALPDGDVIEVEATTYERFVLELRDAIDSDDPTDAAILAAWNAGHGIGIGEPA